MQGSSMLRWASVMARFITAIWIGWCWILPIMPGMAAKIDPYVVRYLRVTDAVELKLDAEGHTRSFTAVELSQGKALFEKNCLSCHVGGTTLPDPTVPLSLAALQGATPPRDSIAGLVSFMRHPMTYDGSEDAILCEQVTESWLSAPEVDAIAGFVLQAAQNAPGWGTETFTN